MLLDRGSAPTDAAINSTNDLRFIVEARLSNGTGIMALPPINRKLHIDMRFGSGQTACRPQYAARVSGSQQNM